MEDISAHESKPHAGPKDIFLHLLTIVGLYFSAGAFTRLIFQYINLYFPDVLEEVEYYRKILIYSGIRWSIATLIIVFPSFILLSMYLHKQYVRNPEKRNLKTRKWLLYFTVSAAAVIIAGVLVGIVYRFLGGELTVRFILKMAAVLFVSGSIFCYYISDLRKYKTE